MIRISDKESSLCAEKMSSDKKTQLYKEQKTITSYSSFDTRRAVNGVCSAGFNTTVQPHANAGPTFQAYIGRGKFHGIIPPATPIGSYKVCIWNGPSAGTVRPWILSAHPSIFTYRKSYKNLTKIDRM